MMGEVGLDSERDRSRQEIGVARALAEDIKALLSLDAHVKRALASATEALLGTVKKSTVAVGAVGWSQFLKDDREPSPGGTACAVLSLFHSRLSITRDIKLGAREYLLATRDGPVWTKHSLKGKANLTLITCLCLHALLDIGQPATDAIEQAVKWLVRIRNEDGGWPLWSREESRGPSNVTSTAYAMSVLARSQDVDPSAVRKAIETGRRALIAARNEDLSWGPWTGDAGTLGHTAHAVEALWASGGIPSRDGTARWIDEYLRQGYEAQELEYFDVIGADWRERVSWAHLNHELALIALLLLGRKARSEPVTDLVVKILGRQMETGHWKVATLGATTEAPVWAIVEANKALALFQDRVAWRELLDSLAEVASATLGAAEKRIQELEDDLRRRKEGGSRKFVAWARTATGQLTFVTLTLALVYIMVRTRLGLPVVAEVMVGVVAFVGLAFGVYPIVKARERARRSKGAEVKGARPEGRPP